jgi:hypothetical protein
MDTWANEGGFVHVQIVGNGLGSLGLFVALFNLDGAGNLLATGWVDRPLNRNV